MSLDPSIVFASTAVEVFVWSRPLGVEQGDTNRFSDDVRMSIVRVPNGAEINHPRAHPDFQGFIVQMDSIESRVDGSVLMKAAGEKAEDACPRVLMGMPP